MFPRDTSQVLLCLFLKSTVSYNWSRYVPSVELVVKISYPHAQTAPHNDDDRYALSMAPQREWTTELLFVGLPPAGCPGYESDSRGEEGTATKSFTTHFPFAGLSPIISIFVQLKPLSRAESWPFRNHNPPHSIHLRHCTRVIH